MSESESKSNRSEDSPRGLRTLMSSIRSAIARKRVSNVVGIIVGVVVLIFIAAWLGKSSAVVITPPLLEGDYYEELLAAAQHKILDQFELWRKLNIFIHFTLIVAALFAAILASITTKENAESLKYWSVVLTAVTAAFASFQSTFHIRENLPSVIESVLQINSLEADYLVDRAKFADELKTKEQARASIKLLELHRDYSDRFNAILEKRMYTLINVGQQGSSSQPAATRPPPVTLSPPVGKP